MKVPEPEATFYTVVSGDTLSKIAKAEYDSWICEDTTVAVVDPQTGKPTGQTVPVGQDDAITVLQAGEPVGTVFEYRVNGTTFWASGWEQTCAG